jgi:hypothetical protein
MSITQIINANNQLIVKLTIRINQIKNYKLVGLLNRNIVPSTRGIYPQMNAERNPRIYVFAC